jgi:diguanylate cyclase (GGDEF)-like protein
MTEPSGSFQFGVDRQTGLATIHEFMRLEAEIDARCRSNGDGDAYGIVLIDIEGLRAINAHYGFDFGDQVLIEIARRLRAMFDELRPRCVARVGGDEFAVLVDGIEASKNLSQLARKIRLDAVGYPLLIADTRIRLRLRTTFRRGPSRKRSQVISCGRSNGQTASRRPASSISDWRHSSGATVSLPGRPQIFATDSRRLSSAPRSGCMTI